MDLYLLFSGVHFLVGKVNFWKSWQILTKNTKNLLKMHRWRVFKYQYRYWWSVLDQSESISFLNYCITSSAAALEEDKEHDPPVCTPALSEVTEEKLVFYGVSLYLFEVTYRSHLELGQVLNQMIHFSTLHFGRFISMNWHPDVQPWCSSCVGSMGC